MFEKSDLVVVCRVAPSQLHELHYIGPNFYHFTPLKCAALFLKMLLLNTKHELRIIKDLF